MFESTFIESVQEELSRKYHFDVFDNLVDYTNQPVTALRQRLAELKQTQYPPNYRIIFYTFAELDLSVYEFLQQAVHDLDIPNFFILIVTSDKGVEGKLQAVRTKIAPGDVVIKNYQVDTPVPIKTRIGRTNFKIPETICLSPWINLEVGNNGEYRPCCAYRDAITDNLGNPYTTMVHSVRDVYSSEYMKNLRKQFLDGQRPAPCEVCWRDEDLGRGSKRTRDRYNYREVINTLDWNSDDARQLVSLDIKLGFTCNLACRICGPHASSSWYQEVKENPGVFKITLDPQTADWSRDLGSNFWQKFDEVKDTIQYIQFSGGEPLLIKPHFKILEYLIEQGVAEQISLHYISNGTSFPEAAFELWDQFRHVEITFSIDNLGDKYEYERHGARWSEVLSNIDRFLTKRSDKYSMSVFCALSGMNIWDAHAVYDFAQSRGMGIDYNTVTWPAELDMEQLPPPARHAVIEHLERYRDPDFQKKIQPFLTKLRKSEVPAASTFLQKLEQLDIIRDQSFFTTHPEISEFL